jgi:hypothetical protein
VRNDAKTLELLALAGLPEDAMIALLANRYVGKPFDMEQCRAVIRDTCPDRGKLNILTVKLWNERLRQEPIRNGRVALKMAAEIAARPYAKRIPDRKSERIRHAKLQFGSYIEQVFASDILALMELTAQDCRSYRVDWLDCGCRPVIAATVRITVEGNRGAFDQGFLLYKLPGTSDVRTAYTDEREVKGAWSMQLPSTFVGIAGELKRQGYTFRTDFDKQAMVVTDPETGRERLTYWTGRAEGDD